MGAVVKGIAEPGHSMSQYASKDDMLKAVLTENQALREQMEAIGAGGVEPLRKPVQATDSTLEQEVREMVGLLKNREWAEHIGKTELGRELEHQITELFNHYSAQLAAVQQGVPDAEPAAWVATFRPEGLLALHSVVGSNLEELKLSVPSDSVFRPLYTHPNQQGVQPDDFKLKVYEALGIGDQASEFAVFVNIENLRRRVACLQAVEEKFFTQEAAPDEDGLRTWECMLSWGATPEQYTKQFAQALATHPSQQGLDAFRALYDSVVHCVDEGLLDGRALEAIILIPAVDFFENKQQSNDKCHESEIELNSARWNYVTNAFCTGRISLVHYALNGSPCALTGKEANEVVDAAIAAQAKQGGASHG